MKTNTVTNSTVTVARPVGRPAAKLRFPNGAFTIATLAALNPHVVTLTLRNHIDSELGSGFLTKMTEPVRTGKRGKPAHRFIRTSIFKNLQARRVKKSVVVAETVTA